MFNRVKETQPNYTVVILGNFYLAFNVCETALKRLNRPDSDTHDTRKINDWLDIAPILVAFLMVCAMITTTAKNHSAKTLICFGVGAIIIDVAPNYILEALATEYKIVDDDKAMYQGLTQLATSLLSVLLALKMA